MTEPQEPSPDLAEPTDVEAAPDLDEGTPEGTTPTSSASQYEEGDAAGGTGGLDAGGAG